MADDKFDIVQSINGDEVIGFTSARQLKNLGWADSSTVSSYITDDDYSTTKHLGMVDLYQSTHNVQLPFLRDLLEKANVMELEEGQDVTYDLPVRRSLKCATAEDTGIGLEKPGIDGGIFSIILDTEYTKGDVLTYDPHFGEQVIVSKAHEVERVGENYKHYVKLVTKDNRKWFPVDKLVAGIEYIKIGHVAGEFDEEFSKVNSIKNPVGSITCRFTLGNLRGVETFYTRKANNMKAASNGLASIADEHLENAKMHLDQMGGKNRDMMFMAKSMGGKIDTKSVKVGATLEYFVLAELAKIECYQLIFQKAGTISDQDGVKILNEGVYHSFRRGKVISYSKPGTITKQNLMTAADHVFKGSYVPADSRMLKFKVGEGALMNLYELFRDEVANQISNLSPFQGTDAFLPESPLKGKLDNLEMVKVAFRKVHFPGIGTVEVEHDPTLDYLPMTDRFSAGNFGTNGKAHTTYSMVIWDASSTDYSNASSKVKGAKVIEGGNVKGNIYYVKPEGAHVTYGYAQGRMETPDGKASNVMASLKKMGREFWAFSESAALVLDTTRYVTIELQESARV